MPAYRLMMTTDTVGGVWRYAIDLARELTAADVAVTLVSLGPPASSAQRREADALCDFVDSELPLDWLCNDSRELARASAVLARLAQQRDVDLVQSNSPLLLEQAARFDQPVAAFHHSCLATWWAAVKPEALPRGWEWRKQLIGHYLRAADAIAAPSQAFANAIRSTYQLQAQPQVIRNGRPPAPPLKPAMSQTLLSAGRLWDEGKAIATLERAAASLRVPVYAAGPLRGPNGTEARLDKVQHLGELSEREMRARLAERPLFVSTSVYEPYGLAVLEAAQAGCPLLLADIPTFRELWDGVAIFFPPNDDAALAKAATDLLASQSAREGLGSRARERACGFTVERSARATRQWHRNILDARPVRKGAA